MLPVTSPRTANAHVIIEGTTGADALLAIFAPRSIAVRIFALKILRAYRIVGESLWTAYFSRGKALSGAITFQWSGMLYEIIDTRGSTLVR